MDQRPNVTCGRILTLMTFYVATWLILSMLVGNTLRITIFCIVVAVGNAIVYGRSRK